MYIVILKLAELFFFIYIYLCILISYFDFFPFKLLLLLEKSIMNKLYICIIKTKLKIRHNYFDDLNER